jgi:hypothetical protein
MESEPGKLGENASPQSMLERNGSYHLIPSADEPRTGPLPDGLYCDLQVDRSWACLRVGSTGFPPEPEALDYLDAAGFRRPDADGRSTSTRAWFRSWAFTRPEDRVTSATEILRTARDVFRVPAGAPIRVTRGPSGRQGDPGVPIVAVLVALFAGYSLVAGWIVLAAWDIVLPGRAHPGAAIWAQVAAPVLTLLVAIAYAVVLPELRLRWVATRRAPSPGEIDRQVPGTAFLGFIGSPVLLVLLLLGAGR